ncbi:MAG: transglycosylase domain-containing protein [Myxococcota bacterium]
MKLAAQLTLFVAAVVAGMAAGTPAMMERAGRRAEASLERGLDADVSWESLDWSWGGRLVLEDVTVEPRDAPDGEAPLVSVGRLALDAEALWSRRRVRLHQLSLQDVRVKVRRRADGSDNLRAALRGVLQVVRGGEGGGDGGDGGGGGLGRLLDRHVPEVEVDGLDVDLAGGLELAGLAGLPTHVALRDGHVSAENTALLKEDDNLTVHARFEDTSLDPGHGLVVEATLPIGGGPVPATVRFDRAARVWLGRRVLAARALAWDGEAVAVEGIALSVPLKEGAAPSGEPVDPAVTAERVRVQPDPDVLASAIRGLASGASVRDLLAGLERIEVERPVLVFERRPGGHNFQDLVPARAAAGEAPVASGGEAEHPLLAATRLATRRLAAGDEPDDGKGFRGFLVRGFERLERDIARVGRGAVAAARAFPFRHLQVRGGRLAWRDALADREEGVSVAGRIENFDFEARREGDLISFSASFLAPGTRRESNRIDGRIQPASGDVQLHAAIDEMRLHPYRHVFPASLPIRPGTLLHDTDFRLVWSPAERVAHVNGELAVGDLTFHYRPVASEPLTDLDVALDFDLQLDAERNTVVLGKSHLTLGDVRAVVRGDVSRYASVPKLTGAMRVDRARCQDILDSLPDGLAPMLRGLRVEGTLAWQLDFSLDTADMDSLEYHSHPELNRFRVLDMGERLNIDAVRGTFVHRIQEADGTVEEILVGPGSPAWVSLDDISDYMVKAVTTTEDGTFFDHEGFAPFAIRRSLIENLEEGEFVRGASTISQQVAKNLFLSREKTISRKLQEMFITWQLESVLEKERIMELYLNVIEWGPGVYGIREAAAYYFGKYPADLSCLEAVFLASLIPSPKRYHHQYERGGVTDGWRRHLRWIMSVMVDRGKITEYEFLAAAPYRPEFRPPDAPMPDVGRMTEDEFYRMGTAGGP